MSGGGPSSRALGLRIGFVTLVLTAALAALVVWRQMPLLTGREVVLLTQPVDPRSLFRGDYVDLTYTVSSLSDADMPLPPDLAPGQTVFVPLVADAGEPGWRAAGVMTREPVGPVLFLRGRVESVFTEWPGPAPENGEPPPLPDTCAPEGCRRLVVDYGIGSYFVPEGQGRRLEDLVAQGGRLSVAVAVGRGGRAAIAGLVVDGERVTREGLL